MIVIEQDNGFWTEIFPNYLAGGGAMLAVIVALWQTHRANRAREIAANEKTEAEHVVNSKTLKLFDSATKNERNILSNVSSIVSDFKKETDYAYGFDPQNSKSELISGSISTIRHFTSVVHRDKVLSALQDYRNTTSSMLNDYHVLLSEENIEKITQIISKIDNCYYNVNYIYNLPLQYAENWSFEKLTNHLDEVLDTENELNTLSQEFFNDKN